MVALDETDFRILREIFVGDAPGFRPDRVTADEIARRLGAHRNTVSARIKRLTAARAFLPASVEVEPGAFGLVGAFVFLEAPRAARTPDARARILAIDGVQYVLTFVEGWTVIVFGEDEATVRHRVEEARLAIDASEPVYDALSTRDYPKPADAAITPLDARLIAALLRDGRAPFGALGRAAGVTATTARRRVERLRDEGALFIYPSGEASVEGMVMAYVSAEGVDPALAIEAMPRHFLRNVHTIGRVHLFLYGASVEAMDADVARLAALPRARIVAYRIWTGLCPSPTFRDWLARVVERRAKA